MDYQKFKLAIINLNNILFQLLFYPRITFNLSSILSSIQKTKPLKESTVRCIILDFEFDVEIEATSEHSFEKLSENRYEYQ